MGNLNVPKKKNENQSRLVSKERNFDIGQLFYPNERKRIFVVRTLVRDGAKVEIKYDPVLGTLNTFDERVFYACVEIWEKQNKPKKCFFSLYGLAERICSNRGGKAIKSIRESLLRLSSVNIVWRDGFYNAAEGEFLNLLESFSIIDSLQIASKTRNGVSTEEGSFKLNSKITDNIEHKFCRPIRFDVILSFNSPIQQSLYSLSSRVHYGTKHYSRKLGGLFTEDLALISKTYFLKHRQIECVKKHRGGLIGKDLGYGEVIESIHVENRRGEEAIYHSVRSGEGKMKGKKVKIPQIITSSQNQSSGSSTQQKTPEKSIFDELKSYFIKEFPDARVSYQPSQEFVELYTNRLEKYGLQKIKACVNICRENAERDRYRVKTLEGIEKYFLEALSHLERQDKLRSQDKQKNIKAAIAKRKQDRKELRMKDYAAFLRQWLASSVEANDAYYNYEATKLKEQESQLNPSTRLYKDALKRVHNVFNLDRSFVSRVEGFFSEELGILFPDFEKWDEENPLTAAA